MSPVTIALPWPPSVNHIWRTVIIPRHGARTLLSADGRAYRKAVADQVLVQRIPRGALSGELSVDLVVRPPDLRARDLDNLLKALMDSVRHAGVIADDADVDELSIKRLAPARPLGSVLMRISEIPGEATTSKPLFIEDQPDYQPGKPLPSVVDTEAVPF